MESCDDCRWYLLKIEDEIAVQYYGDDVDSDFPRGLNDTYYYYYYYLLFIHITLADRYYLCEPRHACLLSLPVSISISLLALQAFVDPSTHLSCVVL